MKRIWTFATIALLVAVVMATACAPPAVQQEWQQKQEQEQQQEQEREQEQLAGMMSRGKLLCAHQEGNCVEAWGGTDLAMYSDEGASATFSVDGATGDVVMGGTTPVLTIGDAGEEDAGVVIDGNAFDFHFLLDDTADDLVIGVGAAAGTTPAITIDENQNVAFGVAATGVDVYFYSDTSGDHTWYDASSELLEVIGTNAATALDVSDGNVVINDTLDVDGTFDFDGTTFDVLSSGGFSIDDSATASNVSVAGAGIDLTISSAAGRVVVHGAEAAADAVYIDADDAAGVGVTADVGSTGGFNIDGGCLNVGGGSPASCADNDAYVTGDFEVDAALDVDGTGDFDVTTSDVQSSGGFSIDDSATASNVTVAGAGIDLTLSSTAGRVVVHGAEAAADAVYIDANDAGGVGVTADVGATGGFNIDGGCLNVGGGSPASCADNDAYVTGDLEVDAALDVDGTIDHDGTTFDVLTSGGFSIDDSATASNISVAGAGIDLTLSSAAGLVVIQASEATGGAIYLDADAAGGVGVTADVGATGGFNIDGGCLNVGGGSPASCGDNDAYVTGDFEVDAALDVDGTVDFDGTTFTVDASSTFSIDSSAAAGNVSVAGAGIDLTLSSAAGRIVIQASEATADAVFIDADGDAAAGVDIDVGATNGMTIDGGCLNIGGGTPASCGDTDVVIAGDLEVETTVDVDGDIDLDGTFDFDAGRMSMAALPGAGATGDLFDITDTFNASDGTDILIGIDMNLTGGGATATGNKMYGLDLDLTTADAQATEVAIMVDDADWDYAIDTADVPAILTAQTWWNDFMGTTAPTDITPVEGNDAQAVQAVVSEQFGIYQITSGDNDAGGCAESCEGVNAGLCYQADQESLVFQARLHIDDITNAIVCVGLTDNAGVEMPGTIGVGTDTPAYTAHDFLAFCYDSGSTTSNWFVLGRDGGTAGTGLGVVCGTAPVNGAYQTFRIEVDAAGEDARFYLNGAEVGTCTANCITITDLLTPVVVADTNADASVVVDIDYIYTSAQRQ